MTKYRKKHSDILSPKETSSASITQGHIFDILSDQWKFEENFLNLSVDEQIEIVAVLHKIANNSEDKRNRKLADLAYQYLEIIHRLANAVYDTGNFIELARDEKRLIRMECYGTINRRKPHELSYLYNYFKKSENAVDAPMMVYHQCLKASPAWRVFHQFESFRTLEKDICRYLKKSRLDPNVLSALTINDYCDIIFNTYKQNDNSLVAEFLPAKKTVKGRRISDIIKYCEPQFKQLLVSKGNDIRCVQSLCNIMKRFGMYDVDRLIVTEINYTPRIIDDLAKAGYDTTNMLPGTPIEQEFIDHLLDINQGTLILARDENGKPLDKSLLPRLQDHHIHSVVLSNNLDTIAAVNYPNNGIEVDERIHQHYLHLFDCLIKSGNIEKYYSRLNITDNRMRVLIGFNAKTDAIYFDLENNREFKRRKAMDRRCKVNYFQMMEERLYNEAKLVETYNIPYPKRIYASSSKKLQDNKNLYDFDTMKIGQAMSILRSQIKKRKGR